MHTHIHIYHTLWGTHDLLATGVTKFPFFLELAHSESLTLHKFLYQQNSSFNKRDGTFWTE